MQLRESIRHYIWIIFHRFWIIVLGVVVCTGTTLGVSLKLPPVYRASALVMVNETTSSGGDDVFGSQALAVSYALLVTRDDVLKAATQNLPGITVDKLKNAVSASPVASTQIIEIRAQAEKPRMASMIANEVAKSFVRLRVPKSAISSQTLSSHYVIRMSVAKLTTISTIHHGQSSVSLSIVQFATPPEQPASPNLVINTIVGAMLSLLVMITLVLLLDWMDDTLKTADDVRQRMAIDALGDVPLTRNLKYAQSIPPALQRNELLESTFADIATNISALSKKQKSLLITSPRSGSGGSTIAFNLAIACANMGMRVLLMDANFRHPSLHERFRCPNTYGLVDSLSVLGEFHTQPSHLVRSWLCQWQTSIPNLWFLPTGQLDKSTSSIRHMSKMPMFVEWLLKHHREERVGEHTMSLLDLVIVDAPAIGECNSIGALAVATDATVLVVEAAKEREETLYKVQEMLQRFTSPILGVIINRTRAKYYPYFYSVGTQPKTSRHVSLPETSPEATQAFRSVTSSQISQFVLPDTPQPLVVLSHPGSYPLPAQKPPLSAQGETHTLDTKPLPECLLKDKGISLPGVHDGEQRSGTLGLKHYLGKSEQSK